MIKEEMITYPYLQQHGIGISIITIKLIDNKNQIIIKKFDQSTELIAKDIDAVSLYGVQFQPVTEISGIPMTHKPYFIAIITEGILQISDYIFYETEYTPQIGNNLKLYLPIT